MVGDHEFTGNGGLNRREPIGCSEKGTFKTSSIEVVVEVEERTLALMVPSLVCTRRVVVEIEAVGRDKTMAIKKICNNNPSVIMMSLNKFPQTKF